MEHVIQAMREKGYEPYLQVKALKVFMKGLIMASSKECIEFVLEQCDGLSSRAMMDEYVLYYSGKVVGGVYDNRLLVKPTPSVTALMPNAKLELPYEGAKEMLHVDEIENRDFLKDLFEAICAELPEPKKRKR